MNILYSNAKDGPTIIKVGQAVEKMRTLKEENVDGAKRLKQKQRQRLKRKMKGGSRGGFD